MSKRELDEFFGPEYNLSDLQNQIVKDLGADGAITEELVRYTVLATLYRTMKAVAKNGRVEYNKLFSIALSDIKPRTYTLKGQTIEKGVRKKVIITPSKKFQDLIEKETGVPAV